MKLTKLFSHSYDEGGNITRNYINLFSNADIYKIYNYGDYLYRNKMFSELDNYGEAVRAFGLRNYLIRLQNMLKGQSAADRINAAVDHERKNRTVGTGDAADRLNKIVAAEKRKRVLSDPVGSFIGWLDRKNTERIQNNARKEWDKDKYMDPEVLKSMGYDENKRSDAEKAMELATNRPTGSLKKLIENNNAAQKVAAQYRDSSDEVHPDAPYYGNDDPSKIINGQWGDGKMLKRAGEYVKTKALKGRDVVKDVVNDAISGVKNSVSGAKKSVSDNWNKLMNKFKK